ncbi:MAG TPA: lysine biosynthesis protein LysX [Candidatus Dormibacteraeota bacterium]|nr:lysine biosynthesis protein LysX [Candidatus Dormibacteraeota bacterium]
MRAEVAVLTGPVRLEERLLLEALSRRRVTVAQVDDRRLVFCLPGPAERFALVINRSVSMTRRRYAARLFEAHGIPVVNPSRVIETCDDKVATTLALVGRGVPVPQTAIALGAAAGVEAVDRVGYPAVIKPVGGSWGRLLARVSDRDAAEAVVEHKAVLGSPAHGVVYAQRYVDKPGRDIRAAVIGGEVVAAMYRTSEHWVTNTARSARPLPCPVGAELEALCRLAAVAVGGGAVAVDVLEEPSGELLVNEVNSTLEFHGLMEATGVDVAGRLVDHALGVAGLGA